MAEGEDSGLRKPFPEVDGPRVERRKASLNRALEESFARVREDILQIKRAMNDHAEQLSELNAKVDGFVNMYEFFEYMQQIDTQMEGFDSKFLMKSVFEEHQKELSEKISQLDSTLKTDEKLKGELVKMESTLPAGEKVIVKTVTREITEMDGDVKELKKTLEKEKELESKAKQELQDADGLSADLKALQKEMKDNAEVISRLQERIEKEQVRIDKDMAKVKKRSEKKN